MTSADLLYLCARPQEAAAAAEYTSFREAMGVGIERMHRHDLVRSPLPDDALETYRAVVVGGSPFNVVDPESSKTDVQRRVERDLERVAAVAAEGDSLAAMFTCYGISVVTRLLGGQVSRGFPEDAGPTAVSLTPAAQDDPLFATLASSFSALTGHKEGTAALPSGAVHLAANEACPVQAYRVGDRLYTTQFHPELTPRAFTERMQVYRNDGYYDARDYDVIAGRVLATPVTEPARLLAAFGARFGAPV
ncbi:GMP synthase [Microbacterium sp. ET2]|uniref:glutamine amidotransferase-related protein n=1 Tax=Microbacterium albipurpureum TaxID=3050384 RepID=UPI00259C88BB|nr:GMP synthase [Microbacterium sp. ET2 (Ac-2212)]WJL96835.1 GMP synthase [Microbacterium sp. ET2 (Ac-2212)]